MPVHDWSRLHPGEYHCFHLAWTAELHKALNGDLLPEGYYALSEQHARTSFEIDRVPDPPRWDRDRDEPLELSNDAGHSGTAVAEASPQTSLRAEADLTAFYALRRRTIAIRQVGGDRLVALVEIASPGNKDRRSSVSDFADKCATALGRGLHLVVIDPFPAGTHDAGGLALTVARTAGMGDPGAPPGRRVPAVSFESAEFLRAYAEPFDVGEAIPELPLFYRPGWYVNLPLQPTYDAAFAGVPRHLRRRLEQ